MVRARADVHRYARRAADELDVLPHNDARDTLCALTEFVRNRTA